MSLRRLGNPFRWMGELTTVGRWAFGSLGWIILGLVFVGWGSSSPGAPKGLILVYATITIVAVTVVLVVLAYKSVRNPLFYSKFWNIAMAVFLLSCGVVTAWGAVEFGGRLLDRINSTTEVRSLTVVSVRHEKSTSMMFTGRVASSITTLYSLVRFQELDGELQFGSHVEWKPGEKVRIRLYWLKGKVIGSEVET